MLERSPARRTTRGLLSSPRAPSPPEAETRSTSTTALEDSKLVKRSNIEDEGVATKSKRVKINAANIGHEEIQPSSKVVARDSSTGERSEREPRFPYLSSPPDDLDGKLVEKPTKELSSDKSFLALYRRPSSSFVRDYGSAKDPNAVPIMIGQTGIPAGPKPRNTLNSRPGHDNPAKQSSKQTKPFDLKASTYFPIEHRLPKSSRQGSNSNGPSGASEASVVIPIDGSPRPHTVSIASTTTSAARKFSQYESSVTSKNTSSSNKIGAVSEFAVVEDVLRHSNKRRKPSAQNIGGKRRKIADAEDDSTLLSDGDVEAIDLRSEIEDSGPGNSGRSRRITRTNGGSTINGRSTYFPDNDSAELTTVQILEDPDIEEVESPDQLNAHMNQDRQAAKTRNSAIFKPFQKSVSVHPESESLSRTGDIQPTKFQQKQYNVNGKQWKYSSTHKDKFDVVNIFSGTSHVSATDQDQLQLCLDRSQGRYDFFINGQSAAVEHPQLIVKLEKINKIRHSDDSSIVVLDRMQSSGGHRMLIINFASESGAAQFVDEVLGLSKSIKVQNPSSAHLAAVAKREQEEFRDQARSKLPQISLQQEQALLTAKAARRFDDAQNASKKARESRSLDNANKVIERLTTGSPKRSLGPSARRLSDRDELAEEPLPDFRMPASVDAVMYSDSRPITRSSSRQRPGARIVQPTMLEPPRWTETHPEWRKDWQGSLVFPSEGKNKSTVDAQDIERLDEGEFLNDNLLSFYLRYLEFRLEQRSPEVAKRIYFMNTFFYSKLTSGKGRSAINYNAVSRWTAKMDLLSYDYIVVPVNEHTHWYVAIICNAPKLLDPDPDAAIQQQTLDENTISLIDDGVKPDTIDLVGESGASESADREKEKSSPSVSGQVEQMSLEDPIEEWPEEENPTGKPGSQTPFSAKYRSEKPETHITIESVDAENSSPLTQMQSMVKGKRAKRKSLSSPRKYNPKDPRIMTLDSLGNGHSPTCSNLRDFLIAEARERHDREIVSESLGMTVKDIPQQNNHCDCGVFLLGYVEKFLENPDVFVHKVLRREMDVHKDWPDLRASDLRTKLRNLIFDLRDKQYEREKAQRAERVKAKKAAAQIKKGAPAGTADPAQESVVKEDQVADPQDTITPKEGDAPGILLERIDEVKPETKSHHAAEETTDKKSMERISPSNRRDHDLKTDNIQVVIPQKVNKEKAHVSSPTRQVPKDLDAKSGQSVRNQPQLSQANNLPAEIADSFEERKSPSQEQEPPFEDILEQEEELLRQQLEATKNQASPEPSAPGNFTSSSTIKETEPHPPLLGDNSRKSKTGATSKINRKVQAQASKEPSNVITVDD